MLIKLALCLFKLYHPHDLPNKSIIVESILFFFFLKIDSYQLDLPLPPQSIIHEEIWQRFLA